MIRVNQKLEIFHKFAIEIATLSTCKRAQVGCIIFPIDFTEILAIGYNGPPSGMDNNSCKESEGKCGCIHAEANALLKIPKNTKEAIMFSTVSPCPHCAGLIINSGSITAVTYAERYRDLTGLIMLDSVDIVTDGLK